MEQVSINTLETQLIHARTALKKAVVLDTIEFKLAFELIKEISEIKIKSVLAKDTLDTNELAINIGFIKGIKYVLSLPEDELNSLHERIDIIEKKMDEYKKAEKNSLFDKER